MWFSAEYSPEMLKALQPANDCCHGEKDNAFLQEAIDSASKWGLEKNPEMKGLATLAIAQALTRIADTLEDQLVVSEGILETQKQLINLAIREEEVNIHNFPGFPEALKPPPASEAVPQHLADIATRLASMGFEAKIRRVTE